MQTVRIPFTPAQVKAVEHRLGAYDCFDQVFSETDGMEHLAEGSEERARELCAQLEAFGFVDARLNEQDQEILRESIVGNTYAAIFDPEGDTNNTPQMFGAAKRALRGAAQRIEQAYGMEAGEIEIQEG